MQHAKAIGVDPNLVLVRYATERFLYRLSRSEHADRFVLKGALLMLVWLGETLRPTRDADLLGFGELSEQSLPGILTDVCHVDAEPDGMEYLPSRIRVAPIRQEDAYGGLRTTIEARLANARLQVQVDVGIGDAVVPEPEWLDYPALLEFPRARLRAYRAETVISEKLHAMVVLGEANSRMRDFFDVYVLANHNDFEAEALMRAVRATFERRRTPLPAATPVALVPAFARLSTKEIQWQGFLRKNGVRSAPTNFGEVIARIAVFLEPIIAAARDNLPYPRRWTPSGSWR
ncbi:MAG TPA: nucleotidyl transferase AbiEii/AbiGii toxin family protein [Steroidobacteraceae bacterium]|nr:nucleotidyl transferase AbiEii/AbiGii toxin family protein [Steroidobacteraceae bacterium]